MENETWKEMWFDSKKNKPDEKLIYQGRQIVEAKDFLPVLKELKNQRSQINFLLILSVVSFAITSAVLITFFIVLKTI